MIAVAFLATFGVGTVVGAVVQKWNVGVVDRRRARERAAFDGCPGCGSRGDVHRVWCVG